MKLQLNPFIMMNGNAQEAIEFYERSLNAQVLFKQTLGQGPADPDHPLSGEEKKLVAHSVLRIGESEIFVSDQIPGAPLERGNQVTICISTDDPQQARQLYDALRVGGQDILPLEATYFSPAYGMVTDKYGVIFQIFTTRGPR